MAFQKDSRAEKVELDYDGLKITAPTDFPQGFTQFNQKVKSFSGSLTQNAGADNVVYSYNTLPGHSYIFELAVTGVCTASGGGNLGKALYQVTYTGVVNNGGILNFTYAFGNMFNYNGLNDSSSFVANGSNVDVHFTNTSVSDTIYQTWYLTVYAN